MASCIVCMASHNELSRRGEIPLRRCLNSVRSAIDYLRIHRPDDSAYLGVCDDASNDGTADFIAAFFTSCDWFSLVRNKTQKHVGFSRNVAASQFDTDYVFMLDADDEYKEDHLAVCLEVLTSHRDPHGRKFLAATTKSELTEEVHPLWAPIISATIPINKAISRLAWDFMEGNPMENVYAGLFWEDAVITQRLGRYFKVLSIHHLTTRYWNYPGSMFDLQLHKFRKNPAQCTPEDNLPIFYSPQAQLLRQCDAAFRSYLDKKFYLQGWQKRLAGYALSNHLPAL